MHLPTRAATALLLASALVPACSSSDDQAPSTGEPSLTTTAPCKDAPFAGKPLGVRCGQLIDEKGRVRYLRGVNARVEGIFDVTFDDGRKPLEPIPPFSAEDAALLRTFGFDTLRLPINWSGIEPTETGGFVDAYLDKVAAVVDAARSAGILVLIDLHQDAYSKEIGEDGAPLWAIYPPPTKDELLGGPLTDLDKRRLSAPVGKAFTTFFSAGAIGETLRGRFIAMAKHVMQRFAKDDAVLGIEIFNEPLSDADGLLRLYQPFHDALRPVIPDKVIVFEPDSTRNFFDKAPLAKGPLGPGTAYAPHTYKLAFGGAGDTDAARMTMTKETLRPQYANAREEAASWGSALLVTEWGYDPKGIRADEYYTWQAELAEEYFASNLFWVWKEDSQGAWGCFDKDPSGAWVPRETVKKWLARVRASAVAGWPTAQTFDRKTGTYTLTFTSDPTMQGPSEIAVAPALGAPTSVTCDGAAVSASPDARGIVAVDCGAGSSATHTVVLTVAPAP